MRENPSCVVTAHAQRNDDPKGLEIYFSGRPPQKVLDRLKDEGWIFAPGQTPPYWFHREVNDTTLDTAEEIAGGFDNGQDLNDPKPAAPELERKGVARQIAVTKEGGKIYVQSPYHKDFNRWVKKRGGKWKSNRWVLDARDEEAVREKLFEVYGTDGQAVPMVDVRYNTSKGDGFEGHKQVFMLGRSILRKKSRDRKPTLGDGVVILEGSLRKRGGSRRYPEITHSNDLVLEIRDVPRSLAEPFVERRDEATIVRENPQGRPSAGKSGLAKSLLALAGALGLAVASKKLSA
ncbi:gp41 [Salisaeta icosahedral phage 1]|uniref:gp41 n=1 Tax=Salisaeta icosahedral phage 1 TaxID=1183239 RepID=UPI00025EA936|nr:gp41 [Salisaeta icosahedral phage 1]AFJ21496.1 gp41 [Salisaeta icosahedral phage 1]